MVVESEQERAERQKRVEKKASEVAAFILGKKIFSEADFNFMVNSMNPLVGAEKNPLDPVTNIARADKRDWYAALKLAKETFSPILKVADIIYNGQLSGIDKNQLPQELIKIIQQFKENAPLHKLPKVLAATSIATRRREAELLAEEEVERETDKRWFFQLWPVHYKQDYLVQRKETDFNEEEFFQKKTDEFKADWSNLESGVSLKEIFVKTAEVENSIITAEITNEQGSLDIPEINSLASLLEELQKITDISETGIAETQVFHDRLSSRYQRLINSWLKKIDANFIYRAKEDKKLTPVQIAEYEIYYNSLETLSRILDELSGKVSNPGAIDERDKTELEEAYQAVSAAIETRSNKIIMSKIDQRDKIRLEGLRKRLIDEAQILLGIETNESEDIFTKDIEGWLFAEHGEQWRKTQRLWDQYQAGNAQSLIIHDKSAIKNLINYFTEKALNLDKADVAYDQRFIALDIQLNRLQVMDEEMKKEAEVTVALVDKDKKDGRGVSTKEDIDEFGEFGKEIIESPVFVVLGRLITNDFPGGEVQKWRRAIERRVEILKEQGHEEIAKFLDEALLLYLFGVWVKDTSINIDKISAIPKHLLGDSASETSKKETGFAQADGRNAYLRLRNTPLFESTIQPLLDRMDLYLDGHFHPELGENGYDGPSFSSSSNDWDVGRQLPMFCHKDLYEGVSRSDEVLVPPNRAYVAAIDALVAGVDDNNKEEVRQDFIEFLTRIALYEASSEDKRGKISKKKLGKDRSAVKHRNASIFIWDGALPPQSWLETRSYKLKNNAEDSLNNGCYMWHTLPPEVLIPMDNPKMSVKNQKRLRKKLKKREPLTKDEQFIVHNIRYRTKQAILEMYTHHQFGKHDAWHKIEHMRWNPDNLESEMPSIEDFHKWQILDSKGNVRFPEITADNFTQTITAMGTMMEKASTCWENDISKELDDMNDEDFGNKIAKEIGDFGTKLAMSLSYTMPLANAEAKPDDPQWVKDEIKRMHVAAENMFKILQSTLSIYAVYLLSQIKIVNGAKEIAKSFNNRKYRSRYKIALDRINQYLIGNGSLSNGYKNRVDHTEEEKLYSNKIGNRLNDRVVKDISDPAFMKQASLKPEADTINFNIMMQFFRDNNLLLIPVDELHGHHHWPFRGKANNSVHEE